MMKHAFLLLALCSLVLLSACDGEEEILMPEGLYTISGKLKFNRPIAIPSDAHVAVLWYVPKPGAPDYAYLFGSSKVNMADSSFRIVFKKEPPDDAFIRRGDSLVTVGPGTGLGVGAIILLNKPLPEGIYADDEDSLLEARAMGLATDYAMIYIKGNRDSVALIKPWARDFVNGFSVGKGIARQGRDYFGPTQPSAIEVIIDDLDELEWVSWM